MTTSWPTACSTRSSSSSTTAAAGAGIFPHAISDSLVAFLDQSSRFLKPVYLGDTVTVDYVITSVDAARERMLDVGRRMFERWVEIAVAVPR